MQHALVIPFSHSCCDSPVVGRARDPTFRRNGGDHGHESRSRAEEGGAQGEDKKKAVKTTAGPAEEVEKAQDPRRSHIIISEH